MITYLYWGGVITLAMVVLILLGKNNFWRSAIGGALIVFIGGWAAYYFHFEQVFVKRYGGVMTISIPEGQQHITATWKDDNLWIENYDPKTNTCHFNEYSKGNILQGKVSLKNCNPLGVGSSAARLSAASRQAPQAVEELSP